MEYQQVALMQETYERLWSLKTFKRKTMNHVIEFLIARHEELTRLEKEKRIIMMGGQQQQ